MKTFDVKIDMDYQTYKTFCGFNGYRNRFYKMGSLRIIIICGLLGALSLLMMFNPKYGSNGYILMGFTLLIAGYFFYVMKLAPKKRYQTVEAAYRQNKFYHMDEKKIEIESEKGTAKLTYEDIFKAYEIDDFFYLYLSNTEALIMDKRNFTAGDPLDFRKILQDNLGKFFNVYCK